MKRAVAITTAIKRYLMAIEGLEGSTAPERMCFVWGMPGAGKTTATAFVVNRTNGVFVRAQRIWNISSMLSAIVEQLEGQPSRFRQPMFDFIVKKLRCSHRSLFVDEADYLNEDMIEVLRDIHDLSGRPVTLIGMDEVRRGLVQNERFMRRITEEIKFLPMDFNDCLAVYRAVAEIDIEEDLLAALNEEAGGNVGLIVNGIGMIEKVAKSNGWKVATLALWNNGSKANRKFFFNNNGVK